MTQWDIRGIFLGRPSRVKPELQSTRKCDNIQ